MILLHDTLTLYMYPEKFLAKVEREEIPYLPEDDEYRPEKPVTREDVDLLDNLCEKEIAKYERLGGRERYRAITKEKLFAPMRFKKVEKGYEYFIKGEKVFTLRCDEVSAIDILKKRKAERDKPDMEESSEKETLLIIRNTLKRFPHLQSDDISVLTYVSFDTDVDSISLDEYAKRLEIVIFSNDAPVIRTIHAGEEIEISNGSAYTDKDWNRILVQDSLNAPISFFIMGHEFGHVLTSSFYFQKGKKKSNTNPYTQHRIRVHGESVNIKDILALLEDERLAHQYAKNFFRKLFPNLLTEDELQLVESQMYITYVKGLSERLRDVYREQNIEMNN